MPSFTHTKVDPKRLSLTALNIDKTIAQLETAIRNIKGTLAEGGGSALGSTWTGPASTQFFAQLRADLEFIESHMVVVRTLNNQLREASGIFSKADSDAKGLVNNLKVV